jgi:hypothetical protein
VRANDPALCARAAPLWLTTSTSATELSVSANGTYFPRIKEIVLGGIDLTQPGLDLIERKTNYVYSTGGHWLMIGFATMIAYDALHGHAPLTDDIRMNLLGVDAKGFDVFKKEYIDSQPPYDIKQYTLTFNPNAKSQTFPMKLQ